MIEVTAEMAVAYERAWLGDSEGHEVDIRRGLAAVLAIVERHYFVSPRPTPEQIASWPKPKRRLKACVENWPEARDEEYDPHCCRWPKSCSATSYDEERVTDADLEPEREW